MFWNNTERNSKNIFFVRGFQRSGTNWVSNLLNLHPDVSCTGEFHFKYLFQAYQETIDSKHGLLARSPNKLNNLFEDFIKETITSYNKSKATVVGDRTPQLIKDLVITNSNYVLVQRDGRDVIVSWMYHLMRINHNFNSPLLERKKRLFQQNSKHFEEHKSTLLLNNWVKRMAIYWNNHIVDDYKSIGFAKDGTYPINVYPLKYEDLCSNTDEIRYEMYKFLGVNPLSAKSLDNNTTPGFKKNNTLSHYRKGEVGRWKLYFSDEQNEIFKNYASQAMNILSYT